MTETRLHFNVHEFLSCWWKRDTKMGKNLSRISSLSLSFQTYRIPINRHLHSFARQLQNLPRLKELTLRFRDSYNWEFPEEPSKYPDCNELEIYRIISSQLKYLSHIKTLKILIYNKISDSCLQVFADEIRHLTNLSSFSIDFKLEPSAKLSKLTLQKFAFAISRLHKLSHFDLRLEGKISPNPQWNKILWKGLGRLENLVTLDLKVFPFLRLDACSVKSFFENFRNLKRLSNLKLDFSKCPEMSTEMIEILFHGFKYFGKLQIPSTLNNARGIQRLRWIAERRYFGLNLKELTVSFPSTTATSFTEETIKGFAKFLLSMKQSLVFLSLDFTNLNKLTDEEMLGFLKHLSNLELLRTLKLHFSDKSMTDYFLRNLSYRLSYLPALSDLQLDLQRTSQVTNKGLRALSEGLSMIKNLSHLDLDFGLLPKVTEPSIQAFFFQFENLLNLEVFKLDFSELPQVNEKTMFALAGGLIDLPKLKKLELDLSNCSNFNDRALKNLANGLRDIPLLGTFELTLYNCRSVNANGIKYLAKILENKSKLSLASLNIYRSKNVSEDFMMKIQKQWKNKTSRFSFILEGTEWSYLFNYDRPIRKTIRTPLL